MCLLYRLLVDDLEAGAQDLVATENFIQASLEDISIERAKDAQRGRPVVDGRGRVELRRKPQAPLGERDGRSIPVLERGDRVIDRRRGIAREAGAFWGRSSEEGRFFRFHNSNKCESPFR